MDTDAAEVAKVQVRFKTKLTKYKVTEKPFQIPVNLNRRGLSQVINHLLGNGMHTIMFSFVTPNAIELRNRSPDSAVIFQRRF